MTAFLIYLVLASLLREAISPGSIVGRLSLTPPDVSNHKNLHLLPKECGVVKSTEEFSGAQEADLFEYPWLAQIGRFDGPYKVIYDAIGSVINNRYILTQSELKRHENDTWKVHLGEFNYTIETYCTLSSTGTPNCSRALQDHLVEKIYIHPKYDEEKFENDIALLRLASDIQFNDAVGPICLPLTRTAINSPLTIAGWFIEAFAQTQYSVDKLYKIKVDYVTPTYCKSFLVSLEYYAFEEKRLCADYGGNVYSCLGWEGTPLLTLAKVDNKTKYVQIGLQSFYDGTLQAANGTYQCDAQDNPRIYTNVAEYIDWILDNLE